MTLSTENLMSSPKLLFYILQNYFFKATSKPEEINFADIIKIAILFIKTTFQD